MSETVFAWHERGDSLKVTTDPGRGPVVLVIAGGVPVGVELPLRAVAELIDRLAEAFGFDELENALDTIGATDLELGEVMAERDELRDERAALIEQRDAALRGLNGREQQLAELRAVLAGDANQEALEILDRGRVTA